jgi:two-component system, NtrC family, sensor kinase
MSTEEKKSMEILRNISNYVGSRMKLDDILRIITDQTSEAMGVPVCSIYLFNRENPNELILSATHGLNPEAVGKARLNKGEGIPGWVAENGEILSLDNGPDDHRFKSLPESNEESYRAYLCAPLRIQEEIIGCMTVRKNEVFHFSDSHITLFETISKQVAIVIEKSRLYIQKLNAEKMALVGVSLSETAHYIKNVLQSMKGGAWFVDQGLKKGDIDKVQKGWSLLQRSTKKISSLVENMLNYSRPGSVNPERGNLNALIVEILKSVVDNINEYGIEIKTDLMRRLPDVYFDWDRINDAMLNLITNAKDAIVPDNPGLISIKSYTDLEKKTVIIEVKDNGSGIPEEAQPKVFNLFFSTKGRRGTGIGLAVTKKIIEDHGGAISFESKEGEGCCFRVELPIYTAIQK